MKKQMMEEAVEAFDDSYPRLLFTRNTERSAFVKGYEQAEKDISALIESIIEGILGDAQPKPVLRAELQELNKRIKNNEITKNQGDI